MNATVKDVMTTRVVAVRMHAPCKAMAVMLREQRVSAFPVLDDDNKVVGVVSEADLMTKPPVTIGQDEPVAHAAIRHEVIDKIIVGTAPTDLARFTVAVKDGIVTVAGTPENASAGRDLIQEIRHVEGVVAVRDRLSYPQDPQPVPVSGPPFQRATT